VPTEVSLAMTLKEAIEYFGDNYDDILWRKAESGDELKEKIDYELNLREQLKKENKTQTFTTLYHQSKVYNFVKYKEVAQLGQGDSFGELALMTLKPRAATITCIEESAFAVMDKERYDRVVGRAYKRKIGEMVDFLRQFRIFKGLKDHQL